MPEALPSTEQGAIESNSREQDLQATRTIPDHRYELSVTLPERQNAFVNAFGVQWREASSLFATLTG